MVSGAGARAGRAGRAEPGAARGGGGRAGRGRGRELRGGRRDARPARRRPPGGDRARAAARRSTWRSTSPSSRRLPYYAVPTSLSNDGFCSPQSSLTLAGRRRSLAAALPFAVVVDTEVVPRRPRAALVVGRRRPRGQGHGRLRLEARLPRAGRAGRRLRRLAVRRDRLPVPGPARARAWTASACWHGADAQRHRDGGLRLLAAGERLGAPDLARPRRPRTGPASTASRSASPPTSAAGCRARGRS